MNRMVTSLMAALALLAPQAKPIPTFRFPRSIRPLRSPRRKDLDRRERIRSKARARKRRRGW